MNEQTLAPRAQPWSVHELIDGALPVALTLLGCAHRESPGTWFSSLGLSFLALEVPVLAGAGLVTLLSGRFGARIQGPRLKPAPMAREAFETARALYVAACFMAWPLTQWR